MAPSSRAGCGTRGCRSRSKRPRTARSRRSERHSLAYGLALPLGVPPRQGKMWSCNGRSIIRPSGGKVNSRRLPLTPTLAPRGRGSRSSGPAAAAASVGLALPWRTAEIPVLCYNELARHRRENGIPVQVQGRLHCPDQRAGALASERRAHRLHGSSGNGGPEGTSACKAGRWPTDQAGTERVGLLDKEGPPGR